MYRISRTAAEKMDRKEAMSISQGMHLHAGRRRRKRRRRRGRDRHEGAGVRLAVWYVDRGKRQQLWPKSRDTNSHVPVKRSQTLST